MVPLEDLLRKVAGMLLQAGYSLQITLNAHGKLEDLVTEVKRSPGAEGAPQDPRTDLARERTNFAVFRTSLALDRTTLAWIRTALTFGTFGFGMIGFFRGLAQAAQTPQTVALHRAAIRMGVALVATGMLATILAASSHWWVLRRLRRGERVSIAPVPLSITLALFIAVLGLYALWAVFAE